MLLLAVLAAPSDAFELTVRQERALQVASVSTAYGFATAHAVVLANAYGHHRPLARDWVPGVTMSSISVVGLAVGSVVLATGFTDDVDDAVTFGFAAPPGFILGGTYLAAAIHGGRKGEGTFWMREGPAAVTLAQGLSVAAPGFILALGANPAESDFSKLAPIYTWAATGTALTAWAIREHRAPPASCAGATNCEATSPSWGTGEDPTRETGPRQIVPTDAFVVPSSPMLARQGPPRCSARSSMAIRAGRTCVRSGFGRASSR